MVAVLDDVLASHINLFLQRPMCHLVQQAAQSMAHNVTNPITFGVGSEVIDYTPAPFHDTGSNTSRILPTIAGWYEVSGKVCFGADTNYRILDAWLRTNGSSMVAGSSGRINLPFFSGTNSTTSAVQTVHTGVHEIQFDGVDDYVELLGVQTQDGGSGDPQTAASGQFASTLTVKFMRLA